MRYVYRLACQIMIAYISLTACLGPCQAGHILYAHMPSLRVLEIVEPAILLAGIRRTHDTHANKLLANTVLVT